MKPEDKQVYGWLRSRIKTAYYAHRQNSSNVRQRAREKLLKTGCSLANFLPFPKGYYEWMAAIYIAHVEYRIEKTSVGKDPFYHAYVEQIFPRHLYEALHQHMVACKTSGKLQERTQDNAEYVNVLT